MDLTTMRRACASTERFVQRVTPTQYGRPTPCAAWDVRDLLNHLVGTLALGEALLGDTRAPRIGPEVAVGADAPATDRLVAYLGRTP